MTLFLSILLILLTLVWCGAVIALAVGLLRLKSASQISLQPSVSIIVAARNEEANIAACIEALLRQEYPKDLLEIVIVNDNSTDNTASVISSYLANSPSLKLVQAPPPPPGIAPKKNAILTGLAATTGEIVLTTDADCTPGAGWVKGMMQCFGEDTVTVAGYSPVSGSSVARFDAFVNAVISAGTIGIGKPMTAVGRNFSWRRSAFEQIGGFGDTIKGASGDDDLLLQRLAKAGSVGFAIGSECRVQASGAATLRDWITMKRRHLSAGIRYSPSFILLFIILYLYHFLIALSVLALPFGLFDREVVVRVLVFKLFVDGITLAVGVGKLGETGWIFNWIIAEIISPFLVVVLTPLALFGRIGWKGRNLAR